MTSSRSNNSTTLLGLVEFTCDVGNGQHLQQDLDPQPVLIGEPPFVEILEGVRCISVVLLGVGQAERHEDSPDRVRSRRGHFAAVDRFEPLYRMPEVALREFGLS